MSTAANIVHTPHTAHPIPLREQAFTLHCQGLRSPAIAQELGVPERTIRAWIASTLDDLKEDLQLNRREQLLLAVERQHQLTAAAWQRFEREATARDALLDAALQSLLAAADVSGASTHSINIHLPTSTPAPRYLSLILQANKETNRLLSLYTLANLHLLTPDSPETAPAPFADSAIAAETATTPAPPPAFRPSIERAPAFQGRDSSVPAQSATDPSTLAADLVGVSTGRPQCLEERFLAETATAASPLPVGEAPPATQLAHKRRADQGPGVRSPAQSATAGANGCSLTG